MSQFCEKLLTNRKTNERTVKHITEPRWTEAQINENIALKTIHPANALYQLIVLHCNILAEVWIRN